ncbi:ATP-binding cassette domain-containing protein [bacterium]|nr:ATP-binding cassette domain-containing protein [bacterium]
MTELLKINNLTKKFPIKGGFFKKTVGHVHAVTDVSLAVNEGEIVGLVGESGCGKSTLGRSILKLIEPDSGDIIFDGDNITAYSSSQMRALRKKMQIIFQDPYSSLNPRMTIGKAIEEPIRVHKIVPSSEAKKRAMELLEKVGLKEEHYHKYPHEFSGGQRQRVGIARALALDPKLIIADEPVSALDVSIQAQIINLLSDLKDELGLTILFIAHDLKVVEHISQKIVVMYLGRVMEVIESKNLHEAKHPYTLSLLSAVPVPDPHVKKKRIILKGDVPSPINPPSGCVFHTRCPSAKPECAEGVPPLKNITAHHQVACILV